MTLTVAIRTPETVWMMTDRRLTRGSDVVTDQARKTLIIQTFDGGGLIGYAGLGATAAGTEPVDWMNNALRQQNCSVEASLQILTRAAATELPRHLGGDLSTQGIIAAVFIDGKSRLFLIEAHHPAELAKPPFRAGWMNRHRMTFGGAGGQFLDKHRSLQREIWRWVRRGDGGRLSLPAVADQLAKINHAVSQSVHTVGANSIITWHRRTIRVGEAQIGHQCYEKDARAHDVFGPRILYRGTDMHAVAGMASQIHFAHAAAVFKDKPMPPYITWAAERIKDMPGSNDSIYAEPDPKLR
jgi:hypothetical protein